MNIHRLTVTNQTILNMSQPHTYAVLQNGQLGFLKKHKIKLQQKPTRSLKSELTHVKDKQLTQNKAAVVYKLGCNECNAVYIGDIGR